MDLVPVELYYEEFGQGFPVILMHGYPLNHTIWMPVVERLQAHARVITPDLRGHGKSPVTDGDYSMRLMAEDIHALMNRLDLQKAVLVGHSMAGYVSLAFARAYPGRLAGLAMVASQAEADSPEKRQGRYITAEEVGRKGVRQVAKSMLPKLTPRKELTADLMEIMLKTPKKGVIGTLKGMAERPDALEWLAEIEVPAVVVAGEQDVIIPLERARTMTQMLRRGWLVEIPEAAHMPMLETPQVVADAIQQLLDLAAV